MPVNTEDPSWKSVAEDSLPTSDKLFQMLGGIQRQLSSSESNLKSLLSSTESKLEGVEALLSGRLVEVRT